MSTTRTITQIVKHQAELTDLGPFTLARFGFHVTAPHRLGLGLGPGCLLATQDVERVLTEGVDVVDGLSRLPEYTLNVGEAATVFTTSAQHRLDLIPADPTDAVTALLAERGEDHLRPGDAFRFEEGDFSIWPLPSVATDPLTHVHRVEGDLGVDDECFDMAKAREILDAHPWVVAVDPVSPGDWGWDDSGITFDVLLPQEVFVRLVDVHRRVNPRHGQPDLSVGSISFKDDVLWPLRKETPDAPATLTLSDGTVLDADILGLRPALLPHDKRRN